MSVVETALTDRQPQDSSGEDVYDDGYLRVEHRNYYMACAGQSIFLPRSEFLIISRLVRSIERVVSAEELWRSAWGDESRSTLKACMSISIGYETSSCRTIYRSIRW
jgi:DNA-binding response OmpR family regulator